MALWIIVSRRVSRRTGLRSPLWSEKEAPLKGGREEQEGRQQPQARWTGTKPQEEV